MFLRDNRSVRDVGAAVLLHTRRLEGCGPTMALQTTATPLNVPKGRPLLSVIGFWMALIAGRENQSPENQSHRSRRTKDERSSPSNRQPPRLPSRRVLATGFGGVRTWGLPRSTGKRPSPAAEFGVASSRRVHLVPSKVHCTSSVTAWTATGCLCGRRDRGKPSTNDPSGALSACSVLPVTRCRA